MSLDNLGDDRNDESGTTRRRLMAAGAATWATVGLAGCSGGQEEETTTTTSEPEPMNYVVTDDMAIGHGFPSGHTFLTACSPSRKFTPGSQAIWYVGVYDPETGDQLTDEDLGEEGVEIHFTNRDWDPVALGWAGDDEEHPAQEWGGSWNLPGDAEVGEVTYEVVLPNPPANSNFTPVGIAANSFNVLDPGPALDLVVSNYTYAVENRADGFVSSCSPEWQFTGGMKVLFAANVYDADTGEEPGTDVINSVTVHFPNGEFDDLELAWQGDAEEHADEIWDGGIELPEDQEPGTVVYEILVDAGEEDAKLTYQDVDDPATIDQFTII